MSQKTPPTEVETSSHHFDVFLSHNSREKPVVERLAEKLKREGFEPWLDKWCLTPAGDWQDELARGLRASSACAVFAGPSGIGSWEDLEYKLATDRMAKDRAFRVFLVLLPGLPEPFDTSALPPFLSIRTWIDLRKGIEDKRSFQSLINGIKGLPLGPERPIEPRNDICPYRGLQTFDEDHAEFFFGRDADIQRLIEKLKVTRFIAVLGPSGSGKSSLVRAGVIPALKKGALMQSDTWTVRVFTPGAHPLAALAANLLRLYPNEAMNKTLDQLSSDERTLHLAVSLGLAQRPATERVVWVIDQFEEIFTLCSDERERAQFLANLLYAAFIPNGRCTVLLTLRADFYQKCAAYPELSARISEQQFLVSLMGADNLRQAIEEPAWHVGLEFEQGLVKAILDAIENQPGALPLLEHALLELWERRRGGMLTLEAYYESGGVEGAIAKRADTIYTSLSPEQQIIVRRIMLRLTQPGEGTEDTRRRATMSELITSAGESQIVEGVTQAMANARLLTTGKGEQLAEQTVDVSHEALIRGWPRLRKWIEEDRAGLRILRRLTEAAREWQPTKDESLLYRGGPLAQAVEWREKNEAALNESEREFLNASVAGQRAIERRRKRVIIGLAAGLLIAIVLATLAVIQWRRADEQAQIALSRQLTAESLALIENDPDLAFLLAVEANRIHESLETRSILLQAMQYREHLTAFLHGHTAEVHKVVFSPDGKLLASASGTNGKDNSVRLWDVDSGRPIGQPLNGHQGAVRCLSFSPDGKTLASADEKGTIILWDVATHTPIGQPLTGHQGTVFSLAISPDNKILASGSYGETDAGGIPDQGEIILWDVATHERIGDPLKGHGSSVGALAFSSDSKMLASGSGTILSHEGDIDYSVMLWNVATRQALGLPLKGHSGAVLSLAFSPDGKVLASGSADKTVKLWDVAAHKLVANSAEFDTDVPEPHTSEVLDVQFTNDGTTLISIDAGNHILMRQVEFSDAGSKNLTLSDSKTTNSITAYFRKMQSMAFNLNTLKWAAGGCWRRSADDLCIEGRVSIWDVVAHLPISRPVAEKTRSTECLAFSPIGKTLATGGWNKDAPHGGQVNLWDPTTGRRIGAPLESGAGFVKSLAYSPDGKMLATGSCGERAGDCKYGEIKLWNTGTRELISEPLTGHNDYIKQLAFSPNGRILASYAFSTIILWNVETRQPLGELNTGNKPVIRSQSIAFSPDGKMLAYGGCGKYETVDNLDDKCLEGEIRLWDVATRQLIGQPLVGHTGQIMSIAFSPDGKTLASAGNASDGTIKFWDLTARPPIARAFSNPATGIQKIVFSPDGETLAAASDGIHGIHNIFLWDVISQQRIGQPLVGHRNYIRDIAFSPDGEMLASSDDDDTILLWEMKTTSWIKTACRIANRNMTRAEWDKYFPNQPYHKTCPDLPEPDQ